MRKNQGPFQFKASSYRYRNLRYKDTTVLQPSNLYIGNTHAGKHVIYIETGPPSIHFNDS